MSATPTRSMGALTAVLGLVAASVLLVAAEDRGNAPDATYVLDREGAPPPQLDPAMSPVFHPGVEVYLPTGEAIHTRRLFEVPGNGHERDFTLRWFSGLDYDGPYGQGWTSSFDARIDVEEDDDVLLTDPDGRRLLFEADGDDYRTPDGTFALLEAIRKGRKRKLKGWRLLHADRSVWEFDKRGRWKQLIRPDGQRVRMSRDRTHALRRLRTPEGNSYKFKYGKDRRLESAKIPGRRLFCFGYDDVGRLVEIERPLREQDAAPRSWSYTYDAQGRLTAVFNSGGGLTAEIAYDGAGRCASITDDDERAVTFDYGTPGEVTCTGRDGFDRTVGFDGDGRITAWAAKNGGGQVVDGETFGRDGLGRLTTLTYDTGDGYTQVFDDSGDPRVAGNVLVRTRTTPAPGTDDHRTTTFTYHPGTNLMTSQVGPDGARIDIDPGFRTGSVFDARSRLVLTLPETLTESGLVRPVVTREFDRFGRLSQVTEADGSVRRYKYARKRGQKDRIAAEILDFGKGTDPATGAKRVNRTVKYRYDSCGRLVREDRPGKIRRAFAYDAWNALVETTDEVGVTTSIRTDDAGFVVERRTPFLDADGEPVGEGSRVETFIRDALGRILSETHSDGFGATRTVRYEYEFGHSSPSRLVSPEGTVQTHEYDAAGRLVRKVRAPGEEEESEETTTYTIGSYDHVRTDPGGVERTFRHNPFGELIETIGGAGKTTLVTRSLTGLVTDRRVFDAEELFSQEAYEYDPAGNRTAVERTRFDPTVGLGGGSVVERSTTTYTLRGFPDVETSSTGATTRYVYDGAAQIVAREQQPLGLRTEYTYDPAGRITRLRSIRGFSTQAAASADERLVWDDATRLVRRTDEAGNVTRFRYDSLGNGTEITDGAGRVTTVTYDALGRRIQALREHPDDPTLSQTTRYEYDLADNLTRTTLPTGDVLTYTYDRLSRLLSETRNGARTARYEYDAGDRVTLTEDGAGRTVSFEYDDAGRVIRRTPSTGGAQTFTWDGNDRLRTGSDTTSGSPVDVRRKFDSLGNLLEDEQPGGLVTQTFDNGNVPASLNSPDGFRYTYTADAAGRITKVGRDDDTEYLQTTYAPGSRKPVEHAFAGVVSSFGYDPVGRLIRVDSDAIGVTQPDVSFEATYDALGRRTSQTREDGRGERWEYDALGRLVAHFTDAMAPADGTPTVFDSSTRYTFDAVSNRLTAIDTDTGGEVVSKTSARKTSAVTYDAQGRPASVDGQALTYAGAGHATNWYEDRPAHDAGERRLELDAFGRVTRVTRASDQSVLGVFQYDVLNRPVRAVEEEFTGVVLLDRRRVFVGCRLIAELSPTPNTGFDGFDLFFVLDPATNGHLANGFKDSFFSELFHQRDTRGIAGHGYSAELQQHNESFQKFGPGGLPHFEFPAGTPFRGAPSLNSVVNAPGLASASIAGVIFDWARDSDDPFLPRRLNLPPDRVNPWGLPRPGDPQPGPGAGDPVGDPDEDWVDTLPDPESVDSSCEDAVDKLNRTLGKLARLENAAAGANQDLYEFGIWLDARLQKLDSVREGLDEILEAQQEVRDDIDFLRELDFYLSGVDALVGAAGEVKDALPNFKDMGKAMKSTLTAKTSAQVDNAVADFGGAALAEGTRQATSAAKGAARRTAFGYVEDTVTGGNELDLSTAGAIGYNLAGKVNSLFGGLTLTEQLAEYDRQFGVGLESIKTLSGEIARLSNAIADRRSFLDEVREAVRGNCAVAEQQLATLAEVWGEADAKPFRDRLNAIKADLATQGVR